MYSVYSSVQSKVVYEFYGNVEPTTLTQEEYDELVLLPGAKCDAFLGKHTYIKFTVYFRASKT